MARRYGRKAQESVRKAMHKRKRGQLKSGRSGRTVKSRAQAVAIGLSEAWRKGAHVPDRPESEEEGRGSRRRRSRKASSSSRKSTASKSRSRKLSSSRKGKSKSSKSWITRLIGV